jgi:hypothetical protein
MEGLPITSRAAEPADPEEEWHGRCSPPRATPQWWASSLNDGSYRYMPASVLWQARGRPHAEKTLGDAAKPLHSIDLKQVPGGA